jgi:uncharacterized protein (TIGR02246 family)
MDNKTQNEIEIHKIIENWAKAVRAEDIEGIVAHHSNDILLFDVPPPFQSKGMAAYRKSWEAFFAWFNDSGIFDLSELNITAGDDVAFCHGHLRCAGTGGNGKRMELMVRLTVCLKKINSKWMVVHEHHSEPAI